MTLVVDASVTVASLVDSTTQGDWARDQLRGEDLRAPHLMPAEAANVLRSSELRGDISTDAAGLAYIDLFALPVELSAFEPYARRVWELRNAVNPYDAWYVALAETLDTSLATLDRKLATAPGPTCRFELPPR